MVWVTNQNFDKKAELVDRAIVEKILLSGEMSRFQHFHLSSTLLGNPAMADEERCQINRVFDYIQTGRIRLVD
ncbi:hypothetical protein [Egbenema bharatensis]|uniref:hypothetical protein n=1 Tax=Egbenema bharatensis TaxID=3463334 RepID=UPI003A878594